jgi:uncharacterized membrane protein YfcA
VVVLAVLAVLSGVLTRALGIGYSLLMAPAAAALLPAGEAVCLVQAIGIGLSGALFVVSGREGARGFGGPAVRALLAGAIAGQVAAIALVGTLDTTGLRIVAGAALLAGCAATVLRPPATAAHAATGVPAGAGIGAVGLLTGITGPFTAVWLTRRSSGGPQLRRCVHLAVAILSATGLALQASLGAGPDAALDGILRALTLAPFVVLGVLLGRPAAERLTGGRHRLAVAGVAALGAVVLLAG